MKKLNANTVRVQHVDAALDRERLRLRGWIGVASKEHVLIGVKGDFAQFSHGKLGPAKRLSKGDWVIFYSSREKFGEPKMCQQFTAIGQVIDAAPTQVEQFPGFKPYRRQVKYRNSKAVDVRPLIHKLSFINDKSRWGSAFRFGFLEIPEADFAKIATKMLPKGSRAISAGDQPPPR